MAKKTMTKRNINQRLDGAHDNAHIKEIRIDIRTQQQGNPNL